ncbi:MAG TPA: HEAT repeat domain-containing protein [Candidatus Ozemobacteraceae bacterium]
MNPQDERQLKKVLEEAQAAGRLPDEVRPLIRDVFERSLTENIPDWLMDGLAKLPGEVAFIRECLAAQEEAIRRTMARVCPPDNGAFLEILRRLGEFQASGEVESLLERSRSVDPALRGIALLRLGECRAEGVGQRILEGLLDPEPYVRKCAIEAVFLSLGARGVNAFERLLETERDPEVRQAAVINLVRSGPAGHHVLERIRPALTQCEQNYTARSITV